jgi:heavy metal sensor kinase
MIFHSPRRLGTRIVISYVLLIACATLLFTAGTAIVLFFQMRAQIKHFVVQDIENVEGLMSFTADGRLNVRQDYHNHPESKQVLDYLLEIRSPDGAVLYRNTLLGNRALGGRPTPDEGVGGYSERATKLADGTRLILGSRRHSIDGRPIVIRLAESEEPVWRSVKEFLLAASLIFPILVGAAAIAAQRMSRSILTPVQLIASQARRISSSSLHERVPLNGTGDELDELADVFNQTLTRLDASFQQLRQFTSDVSHELRTPLAVIRSVGEVGLTRNSTGEEYRELVGSMLEEVGRLTTLIDELLMISRADSGAIQLRCSDIRAENLVRDTVAMLEPIAEEKQQQIVIEGQEDGTIHVDPILVRQALVNILHNAIKYSPEGTGITVRLNTDASGAITVSVSDAGPGIAPEHLKRVFDRFYRVDQGRSGGGFGLGLAIAQWVIHAHRGKLEVTSEPGRGSTFALTLPLAPEMRRDGSGSALSPSLSPVRHQTSDDPVSREDGRFSD